MSSDVNRVARVLTGADPKLAGWADVVPILVAAGVTFGVARASWQFFERPFVALGHRATY